MMMRLLISSLAWLQTSFIMRLAGVRPERRNAFLESRFFNAPVSKEQVTWFHASSLGELEMLRPLIEDIQQRGMKIGVTCFSDSALKALQTLKGIAVYADLSPREDEWNRLFDRFTVNKVILAKYDFWPGLLNAASRANAPVLVINAQMRRSLIRILEVFRLVGVSFPRLFLFPNDQVAEGELQNNLSSKVTLFRSVDPRWERVARRMNHPKSSSTVIKWSERIAHLKKPIGILGSAWPEDLEVLLPALRKTSDSLIIVPHDLSDETIECMENQIQDADLSSRVLLVSEMGILVELYKMADWAFVGGGFGHGIHSLLEPAAYSIPVACGPNRYYDFVETKELSALGILTRCESTQAVERWLKEKNPVASQGALIAQKRKGYQALLEECLRIQ